MAGGALMQTAGELLPTLVVPGGAALKGASKLPVLGKALARLAPRSIGAAATDAALMGAASAALRPTMTDESRLGNTALGAAGGGLGAGVIGAATKYAPLVTRVGRDAAARQAAGAKLTEALGDEAAQTALSIEKALAAREAMPAGSVTKDIPLTAAQAARVGEGDVAGKGSQILARQQMGVMGGAADDFGQLARQQNDAIFEAAVDRAGVEGTEGAVQAFKGARDIKTEKMREEALQAAARWPEVGAPLRAHTEALRGATAAGSPARRLADLVDQTLAENPSPAQLYELRKMLASKLSGPHMPGDDVAAIVKGANRATVQLIDAIDARLNEAAQRKGGSAQPWTDYLERYKAESPSVTSARAQQQINEALSAEGRPMVGTSPQVTRHALGKALEKYGSNYWGSRLTPQAQGRYDELMTLLNRMDEPMRSVKLGGTGGGGSQTATQLQVAGDVAKNAAAGAAESHLGGTGFALRAIMSALDRSGAESTKRELAQLMLDPGRAAQAIRAKLAERLPLTYGERLFLQATRGTGAGLPLALSQQQSTQ
jgi:hypothetical protein